MALIIGGGVLLLLLSAVASNFLGVLKFIGKLVVLTAIVAGAYFAIRYANRASSIEPSTVSSSGY